MSSTTNDPQAANQDWSKFDFTTWNLEGLQLDASPQRLAFWVRDVTQSPQGQEAFATGLAAIKSAILTEMQSRVKTIKDRAAALTAELNTRVEATNQRISAVEASMREAATAAAPTTDVTGFRLAVKIVDETSHLGLPGVQIRLHDALLPNATVASATSDLNGNSIFNLSKEQTTILATNKVALAVEVLTPDNKSIPHGGQTVVPQVGVADTLVIPLATSPALASHLKVANSATSRRTALLTQLAQKEEIVRAHYERSQNDLQQQLEQLQAMLSTVKPK